MNTRQHTKAVDLEHSLKVAANQARDDCHNGVIILALRVLEQQGVLRSPSLEPGSRGAPTDTDDGDVTLTSVEAAALAARDDRKAAHARDLLDGINHAVKVLDDLRHSAAALCSGLDAHTYARRCTDGYSKACRDRDMLDPKPTGSGSCDACRKARERDREIRNLSA